MKLLTQIKEIATKVAAQCVNGDPKEASRAELRNAPPKGSYTGSGRSSTESMPTTQPARTRS